MMKPSGDPFYRRRKEAMDSLRSLVLIALRQASGRLGETVRAEVLVGKPGATVSWSVATSTRIYHVCVERTWRMKVHNVGLAVIGDYLCLQALPTTRPANADGCWRALLFSPSGGGMRWQIAVRFAGVTKTADTATAAYKLCLDVFRDALNGEGP